MNNAPANETELEPTKKKEVMTPRRKLPLKREDWPRIRDTKIPGKSRYVVDLRPHVYGKGSRLYFEALDAAKLKAKQFATEHLNKGIESIQFSSDLRIEAIECVKLLEPYGRRLREAVQHYVDFLETEKKLHASLNVTHCIDEYIKARQLEVDRGDFAPLSMVEVKNRMAQFKVAWGTMPIMAVTRRVVEDYLNSIPLAARTRRNIRATMSTLFNFCVAKEWIDVNPVAAFKIKFKTKDVQIVNVEQAKNLMEAAVNSKNDGAFVPYFAISLFAGLRPGELEQLDWSRVDFQTKTIEVLAATSKVRETRYVKMEDNLVAWLKPHRKDSGLIAAVLHDNELKRELRLVKQAAGWFSKLDAKRAGREPNEWVPDIMRHSYGSYWLAVHHDRARLAELMGNDVKIIKHHYRRPILESTAKKYWKIRPS